MNENFYLIASLALWVGKTLSNTLRMGHDPFESWSELWTRLSGHCLQVSCLVGVAWSYWISVIAHTSGSRTLAPENISEIPSDMSSRPSS